MDGYGNQVWYVRASNRTKITDWSTAVVGGVAAYDINLLTLDKSSGDLRTQLWRRAGIAVSADQKAAAIAAQDDAAVPTATTQTPTVPPTTGGGSGSTVTLDSDGTLVVNGTTLDVGTDAEIATAIATASATAVHLTGNETVGGVKTFSASPIVPTATTNGQAVNKGQVDTAVTGLAPLASPALTGTPTVDGVAVATATTASGTAAGLAIVFGG